MAHAVSVSNGTSRQHDAADDSRAPRSNAAPLRLSVLGATGSIGTSALSVVDAHPDRLQVVALAAGKSAETLQAQLARYRPKLAAIGAF